METIAITSALQIVAELIPLVQSAIANGQSTVDVPAELAAAVKARDAALNQLDLDISKA